MTDNSPVDFKLKFFQVWSKGSHQILNFEWSGKNLPYSSFVIFQTTGQLKVMLDKSVKNVLGEGM